MGRLHDAAALEKDTVTRVQPFQSQVALVYNCNEDVVVATFISGLQATHSFYKYLVKNDVTKMRDILVRA